jgi:hypothetical protein
VVPARTDLQRWQEHLERHGVVRAEAADKPLTQSAISDQPYGSVLVFRDPDNIQLELFATPRVDRPARQGRMKVVMDDGEEMD